MSRFHSQRQALQPGFLGAGRLIVTASRIASRNSGDRGGASEGIGDRDVNGRESGHNGGFGESRGRSGCAYIGDAVDEALDGGFDDTARCGEPGSERNGGDEERTDAGGEQEGSRVVAVMRVSGCAEEVELEELRTCH